MSVISTDGKTGTPFKLDKNHTVYYKGKGITELDAAHVAGFLKGVGYFTETNQNDVQVASTGVADPVRVGYIIGGTTVSPETESFFKGTGTGLQEFFPGRTVTIHLLDTNLKELKSI
ncbi:MAG: hypothetical protein ABI688_01835 [Bacteroidota bacterium]